MILRNFSSLYEATDGAKVETETPNAGINLDRDYRVFYFLTRLSMRCTSNLLLLILTQSCTSSLFPYPAYRLYRLNKEVGLFR